MLTVPRTLLFALATALCTASCSTSPGQVPLEPSGTPCALPASVQLSNPTNGAQGVSTSIGEVRIVVNASNDPLGTGWDLVLLELGTNVSQTPLTLLPTPGSPKSSIPAFYQANVPPLYANDIYQVYLIRPAGACAPNLIGAFTTQ